MLVIRYFGLVLLTGVMGFLSSFFFPFPNGMMAAFMAAAISGGTIWLSEAERRSRREPAKGLAVVVGLASGVFAAVAMLGAQALYPYVEKGGEGDFLRPPEVPAWAVIAMGILYGLVLHLAYFRRRYAKHPLRTAAAFACLGGFLIKLIGGSPAYWDPSISMEQFPEMLMAVALYSLLGAVPFAFLWIAITASIDPAWSADRRAKFFEAQPSGS